MGSIIITPDGKIPLIDGSAMISPNEPGYYADVVYNSIPKSYNDYWLVNNEGGYTSIFMARYIGVNNISQDVKCGFYRKIYDGEYYNLLTREYIFNDFINNKDSWTTVKQEILHNNYVSDAPNLYFYPYRFVTNIGRTSSNLGKVMAFIVTLETDSEVIKYDTLRVQIPSEPAPWPT